VLTADKNMKTVATYSMITGDEDIRSLATVKYEYRKGLQHSTRCKTAKFICVISVSIKIIQCSSVDTAYK
jgi:hypothetical protein